MKKILLSTCLLSFISILPVAASGQTMNPVGYYSSSGNRPGIGYDNPRPCKTERMKQRDQWMKDHPEQVPQMQEDIQRRLRFKQGVTK